MSQIGETCLQMPSHSDGGQAFFTTVGCMDGRVQEVVAEFGRGKFGAQYPDTITEAGFVGQLARLQLHSATADGGQAKEKLDQGLLDSIKQKLLISLEKHHSKGIIVHGHQECAGNPVDDIKHKDDIRKSVQLIQSLINSSVSIVGVFVKRSSQNPSKWEAEEV